MVSDVQGWLNDPTTNFGWALLGDESGPGTARRFYSRESGSTGPSLQIDFTPPSGPVSNPEPGTITLLAVGGLALGGYTWRRGKRAAG
jgi:hypothetical protein